MASFVEQATLVVKDKSTAQINKINASLKQLNATARSLKSVKIDVKVDTAKISRASAEIRRLKREMSSLKSNTQAKVNVNTSGISQARAQLNALRQSAARTITVTTRQRGTISAMAGGGGGVTGRGPMHGFARGAASGLGVGGVVGAFGAVSSAGYLAARALRAVADSAMKRDRVNLATAVTASKAQQEVFERMSKTSPKSEAPIRFSESERKDAWRSLLGDVPGRPPTAAETAAGGATLEAAKARDRIARAEQAFIAMDRIERDILPRIYAAGGPEMTKEKAQEGWRNLQKAINLASPELMEPGTNKFTKRAEEVINAITAALVAEPELRPQMIKTAMAHAKTSGLTLDFEGLATMLFNVSDRGVRAANEINSAIQSVSGRTDNKALNEGLAKLGLIKDFERFEKEKGQKRGKILPGTAKAAGEDPDAILRDIGQFLQEKYVPDLTKRLLSKGLDATDATVVAGQIGRDFTGINRTALQAITDSVVGYAQNRAKLDQSIVGLEQNLGENLQKSLAAQTEGIKTSFDNAFAGFGEKIVTALNIPGIIATISKQIEAHPDLTAGGAAAGIGAAVAGLGIASLRATFALNGLAAAATAASAAQGGGAAAGAGGAAAAGAAASRAGLVARVAATAAPVAAVAGAAAVIYGLRQMIASTTNDPSGQTNQMIKLAEEQLRQMQRMAATETDPVEKEQANVAISELKEAISKLNSDLAYQEGSQAPTWMADTLRQLRLEQKPDIGETTTGASAFSTQFLEATAEFRGVASTFPEVFQTGGQAIAQGGQNAASALQGAAPGIGDIIGNQAAVAIRAAVSNLDIKVNATVTGANVASDKGGNGIQ